MDSTRHQKYAFGLSGRAVGLVLIFLTAIIWVAASFISQLLVNTEEGKSSFNVSPFLLTYLSTSIFTIFLPIVQLKSLLQNTLALRRSFRYKPLTEADADTDGPSSSASATDLHQQSSAQRERVSLSGGGLAAELDIAEAEAAEQQATAVAARASAEAHKESLIAAAQCFLLWFTAQYLFNKSLSLTSVTSNTILSSSSSLFTFALSMLVLKEPYSLAKLLSIAACIGGTLLVTLSDDSSSSTTSTSSPAAMGASSIHGSSTLALNTTAAAVTAAAAARSGPSHSVIGDLLCLVSAGFYAGYTIVLRKSLPDDDEANVALFFGYVGLLCSVVFAPVVAVLAGLGTMHLKSIPTKAYLIILVEGLLNYCLSDYLWAHAVLLLGPTIATLGLSVQIPVAAVVEVIIGVPKWLSSARSMVMMLCGTALIMVGFFAGNLAGGGKVAGAHHRGDAEQQQQQRRLSLTDDELEDHTAFGDMDLYSNGSVVIPVSTHASEGPRQAGRSALGSSNNHTNSSSKVPYSNGKQGGLQQSPKTAAQSSPRYSPTKRGAVNGVDASHVDPEKQRLSVEMSSFDSGGGSNRSTPMSVRDGVDNTGIQGRPGSLAAGCAMPCTEYANSGAVQASAEHEQLQQHSVVSREADHQAASESPGTIRSAEEEGALGRGFDLRQQAKPPQQFRTIADSGAGGSSMEALSHSIDRHSQGKEEG